MTTEQVAPGFFLESHFVQGLAPIVAEELQSLLHTEFQCLATYPDAIRFQPVADLAALNQMRTSSAVYLGRHYAIPRPKALLGHQNFHHILQQIEYVRQADQQQPFHSFRLRAAGAHSAVFRRLSRQIEQETGLMADPTGGDLAIRIFPTPRSATHWTILCRLTPRPLSTRAWRVVAWPGALNATIAAAMVWMSRPRPTDRVLNLLCGSGTLLIERLLFAPAEVAIGCDINPAALAAARKNLQAAFLAGKVELHEADATQLPFPAASFDCLVADLPWGHLIGDHGRNAMLYPPLLQEAARVAQPGASFVLITTEVRLLEAAVQRLAHLWQVQAVIKLVYEKLYPRIYLLRRL